MVPGLDPNLEVEAPPGMVWILSLFLATVTITQLTTNLPMREKDESPWGL